MNHFIRPAAVLFIVVQLSASFPARAQTPAADAPNLSGPRLKFSETSFDFGRVKSSDVVRHDFVVTNVGNAPLVISEVKPACGCTMAGGWDRQIQPGQTGKIPIQFNPASFDGKVTKTIAVLTNDSAQAAHSLEIKASIWRPIDVKPAHLHFMPTEGEPAKLTQRVLITSNLAEPLSLQPPESANPALKFEVNTLQPGKQFELKVTYIGIPGNVASMGSFAIKTSSSDLPVITVAANVMPQPALALIPDQFTLPSGKLSGGHQHVQVVLNNSSTPMKVDKAAVNAEGVSVEVAETQPGKLYTMNVNFPPNFEAVTGKPLQLTVHTSNPNRPVITVPIDVEPQPSATSVPPPQAAARSR